DQVAHADATQANSKPYEKNQYELRDKRAAIKHDSRNRTVDRAELRGAKKRVGEDQCHDQQSVPQRCDRRRLFRSGGGGGWFGKGQRGGAGLVRVNTHSFGSAVALCFIL